MKKELITKYNQKSPVSEIFRSLRTNIQFMEANKGMKTFLFTSVTQGEGKTWISSNLAVTFAQEGKKVLIIDADMRKSRLHLIFRRNVKNGLSNYLSGISDIDIKDKENLLNYIEDTEVENLYIMTAGDTPPNPSELLVLEKTMQLIDNLKNMFDVIIFDAPPCLIVTDALILSRQVDATIIVTKYKSTKIHDIKKAKNSIEKVGGKILGIVINKIPISSKEYRKNSYYIQKKDKIKSRKKSRLQEEQKIENASIKEEVDLKDKINIDNEKKIDLYKESNLNDESLLDINLNNEGVLNQETTNLYKVENLEDKVNLINTDTDTIIEESLNNIEQKNDDKIIEEQSTIDKVNEDKIIETERERIKREIEEEIKRFNEKRQKIIENKKYE